MGYLIIISIGIILIVILFTSKFRHSEGRVYPAHTDYPSDLGLKDFNQSLTNMSIKDRDSIMYFLELLTDSSNEVMVLIKNDYKNKLNLDTSMIGLYTPENITENLQHIDRMSQEHKEFFVISLYHIVSIPTTLGRDEKKVDIMMGLFKRSGIPLSEIRAILQGSEMYIKAENVRLGLFQSP